MTAGLAAEPLEWFRFAACIGADPELFHPVAAADPATGRALRICGSCPVREPCLEFAMSNGESGVWGGTIDDERRTAAQRERARRFRETRRDAA